MIECKEGAYASRATIARLPMYLRYLKEKEAAGEENVSSTLMAEDMRLNAVQVRKDLALVSSVSGRPKLGFKIKELIFGIENFLGFNNTNDALLAGVGGLGSTLLSYEGFKKYGLNIVAAFDVNPRLIGSKINNIPVLGVNSMGALAQKLNVKMGIITVPKEHAQEIADLMVQSGIKAIWNFAPTHLSLPAEIVLKNEDLAASLAVLSQHIAKRN